MNDTISDEYFELTHMIERLHRRQLDVLRGELNRLGIRDVSPAQAMLLTNIEGDDILYRELVDRGYYLGSNAAYNVKKLVGAGYLDQERASHDRRAVKLQLSEKGRELCAKLDHAAVRERGRISPAPYAVPGLQDHDLPAGLPKCQGGQQPGCARANYDAVDFSFHELRLPLVHSDGDSSRLPASD